MVAMPAFAYEQAGQTDNEARRMLLDAPLAKTILADLAPAAPNTALHGGVLKSLAGINAFILLAFWITLRSDKEALFMVAISAFYLLAYMGTPWMMGRVSGQHLDQSKPLAQFLKEPFETWTGVITGKEAMIQVLTVPVAIALAVTGMCLIIAAQQ